MALVGILPPDDPRLRATIDAVAAGPSDARGLVYRYRNDGGLAGQDGAFLLCTFWLAEALAVTGRPEEAEEVLLRGASCADDLGRSPSRSGTTGSCSATTPRRSATSGWCWPPRP